jgi:hypothetical protein
MTVALERAFAEAAKLPTDEQDLLAARLLAELAAEDEFDNKIAGSGDKLGRLAAAALAEFEAGDTEPLDPERP